MCLLPRTLNFRDFLPLSIVFAPLVLNISFKKLTHEYFGLGAKNEVRVFFVVVFPDFQILAIPR
jgi:hypothetical protein